MVESVFDVCGWSCSQRIIGWKGDEANATTGRRDDCPVEGTSDEVGKAR